jgi:hypothetical protein
LKKPDFKAFIIVFVRDTKLRNKTKGRGVFSKENARRDLPKREKMDRKNRPIGT